MAKILNLEVVTPERIMLQEETQSIIVPAAEGLLGLLPNHAPIITGLNPGLIKFRQGADLHVLAIGGGFMEVSNNKVSILADTAELPDEIDVDRANAAKERAQQRLKEPPAGLDVHRAELAFHRAMARIRAAEYK